MDRPVSEIEDIMEIILKEQTIQQAKQLYDTHMRRDFPQDEIKPWEVTVKLYEKGIYEMLEAYSGGEMVGYIWMVCSAGDVALIDYLAVLPEYRGGGVGTEILKELVQRYRSRNKDLILESEFPDTAPEPQIAKKRLGFYARAGFRDTGTQVRLFGVHFCILSHGLTGSGRSYMEKIYREMFPEELYRHAVSFLK